MTDGEGGVTNYTYNNLNLLATITNPAGKAFTFTYDTIGRRAGLTYPNGINSTYSYDPANGVTEMLSKLDTLQITKNVYTYDSIGNRLTNTDLTGTHSYQYDTTYQLIQATHPTMETEAFTYDKTGNRITETRGQTVINYTTTKGNRIQAKGDETYSYDKNGNMTSIATPQGVTTYEYDYENKLKKATMPDGTIAEYKYDPLGRRIEKTVTVNATTTTTRYLYDGDNILYEYDGNNSIKTRFTHNLKIDDPLSLERNGNAYYYQKDALGTITAITDSAGNTVQRYEYDSFGNITFTQDATFIQPFTFTGREYDHETGLYHYRARTYNSKIGTFMQEDPIGFAGNDMNLHRMVGNNPVNLVDPYGLYWFPIITRGGGKGILSSGPGAMTGGIIGAYAGAGLGFATGIPGMPIVGGMAVGWVGTQVGSYFDPPCAGLLNCEEPIPYQPTKPTEPMKCH